VCKIASKDIIYKVGVFVCRCNKTGGRESNRAEIGASSIYDHYF
jgi:hypothetical protein